MKTVQIGTLQKPVSRMGLGTWAMGGGSAWGGDRDQAESVAAIREAPALGVNLIDTAPGYNFGTSERIIGAALEDMNRENVILVTKFGVVWDREGSPFNKVNGRQLYWNLSRESVLEEIDRSLERMRTPYVDVYMSHWQSVEPFYTPISETMETLNELKAQGKIRAIGAANVTPEQVEEYLKWGSLDLVQAKYSVLDRAVEETLLPLCRERGIVFQAYSPLEMGLLSGALPRDYKPVGAQIPKKWFQPENLPRVFDFLDRLKPLTEKYQCGVADLCMAWILAQGDNVILLSGASKVRTLRKNVRALEIDLTDADAAQIRAMAEELD